MVARGDRRGAYNKRPRRPRHTTSSLAFEWRMHNGNGLVRVWRTDWFGDQFEIMNSADFAEFNRWAKRFAFIVRETEE